MREEVEAHTMTQILDLSPQTPALLNIYVQ